VTLLNESTGISATTVSDSFGNYHFLNVRAGTYTITAEQAGFRTFSTTKVVVSIGARQRVDITMEVGGVTEAVAIVDANVVFNPGSDVDPTGRISDFRGANSMRPNLIGDPTGSSGAARLDTFRGPGLWQMDLALQKSITIPSRENLGIQFRSEFFNLFNRTNFRPPEPNFSSASFGTIRSTFAPRQIQFALKVVY